MDAPQLVVFGSPSRDRIEIRGSSHSSVGGSGFITALAARVAGASVGLVGRVPSTLPTQIARAFAPGGIDPGGLVPVDGSLSHFHITYDRNESAQYVAVELGEQSKIRAADVPRRWLTAAWIHVGSLAASASLQLQIVEGLVSRGYRGGLSAGTFIGVATSDPATVRKLFDSVDIAFLNQDEAKLIYPAYMPSRTVVFVTAGRSGVRRWDGSKWTEHATTAVRPVDPTGAGDAFAGGYLGGMLTGLPNPVDEGLRVASTIIQGLGAAPLIDGLPTTVVAERDVSVSDADRAEVDDERIATVGATLRTVAAGSAVSFSGMPFPEPDDPLALEVLALATLHQYGFWADTDHGYGGPMWALIDGMRWKGSDFIWRVFTRAAADDATVLDPARLAAAPLLFDEICLDDDGVCPIPDVGSHRGLQQAYGAAVGRLGGIRSIVDQANARPDPLTALLDTLVTVPGYGEDPLAKKANLLALILANRPERFLRLDGPSSISPIIDYHNMRTLLRTGCVNVKDPDLRRSLEDRSWTDVTGEGAIRSAVYDSSLALCDRSGLDIGAVDGFLFRLGRTVCIETEEPKCTECPLGEVCARHTGMFQPIFRTTAY